MRRYPTPHPPNTSNTEDLRRIETIQRAIQIHRQNIRVIQTLPEITHLSVERVSADSKTLSFMIAYFSIVGICIFWALPETMNLRVIPSPLRQFSQTTAGITLILLFQVSCILNAIFIQRTRQKLLREPNNYQTRRLLISVNPFLMTTALLHKLLTALHPEHSNPATTVVAEIKDQIETELQKLATLDPQSAETLRISTRENKPPQASDYGMIAHLFSRTGRTTQPRDEEQGLELSSMHALLGAGGER